MKARLATIVPALSAVLTGYCVALTPVVEKFNGTKLDSSRWYSSGSGKGKLSPAKGKLNFVDLKPTRDDFSYIELISSRPGFTEDWEMTLDIANTSGLGTEAGCGFFIVNMEDYNDYLYVQFFGKSGIAGGVRIDGNDAPKGQFVVKKGIPKGGLRVSYNRKKHLMTFYASATGKAKGYVWEEIGTFSPTGSGGDVNADWGINPDSGAFGIQLFGHGVSRKVPAGVITLDNFSLTDSL